MRENEEYVRSIEEDLRWLGCHPTGGIFYGSDYFGKCYEFALRLIKAGKAYVCDLSADEMREYRGTLTQPGKNSPWRERSVEENLDLFERMRAGEFADGEKVLRAKIDMAHPNMLFRDPILATTGRAVAGVSTPCTITPTPYRMRSRALPTRCALSSLKTTARCTIGLSKNWGFFRRISMSLRG